MSTETNHTPGPWDVVDGRSWISVEEGHRPEWLIERRDGGYKSFIASLRHCEPAEKHGGCVKANACLVAAAPDMLEALDRLLSCPGLNLDTLEDETVHAIRQAQAAIEKAEGKDER